LIVLSGYAFAFCKIQSHVAGSWEQLNPSIGFEAYLSVWCECACVFSLTFTIVVPAVDLQTWKSHRDGGPFLQDLIAQDGCAYVFDVCLICSKSQCRFTCRGMRTWTPVVPTYVYCLGEGLPVDSEQRPINYQPHATTNKYKIALPFALLLTTNISENNLHSSPEVFNCVKKWMHIALYSPLFPILAPSVVCLW